MPLVWILFPLLPTLPDTALHFALLSLAPTNNTTNHICNHLRSSYCVPDTTLDTLKFHLILVSKSFRCARSGLGSLGTHQLLIVTPMKPAPFLVPLHFTDEKIEA